MGKILLTNQKENLVASLRKKPSEVLMQNQKKDSILQKRKLKSNKKIIKYKKLYD